MPSVYDVARYLLETYGPMSAMKLQKLVYYSQAWSLVWDDRPMFDEPLEAWANGPVVYDLYQTHRSQFTVQECPKGDVAHLDKDARETIDAVWKFYGDKSAQYLSDLTHLESPWKNARQGLAPGEVSRNEITIAAMHEYYSGLQ